MTAELGEWLTHHEAVDFVGCSSHLLRSYISNGAVHPHPGDPSLVSRESVLRFKEFFDERMALKAWHRAQPNATHPPEPTGWLTTEEAAAILGCTTSHARRLLLPRGFRRHRGKRDYYEEDLVRQIAAERSEWVSFAKAAEIAGVTYPTVKRAVRLGLIEQRTDAPHQQPSLRRTSVEEWMVERAKPKTPPTPKLAKKPKGPPVPDLDHEWLPTKEAARRLGVSETMIKQLAIDERMPATRSGGRWWFRADLLEQYAAAREASRRLA